jgi:hypothetical protein
LLVISLPNMLLVLCLLVSLLLYPNSRLVDQLTSLAFMDQLSMALVFFMILVYPVTSPIIGGKCLLISSSMEHYYQGNMSSS